MDDENVHIEIGDAFEVAMDPDGFPAIRIQNVVFQDEPKWITFSGHVGEDARRQVSELIATLGLLRSGIR